MKLIVALPYHTGDHLAATRLLNWIKELSPFNERWSLILVADNAVPMEIKKPMDVLGKSIFSTCETIMPQCPSAVNGNYHIPAAVMFEKTASHIMTCYKDWPWLWMEPDCVPLVPHWLLQIYGAYELCPKRYMGSTMQTGGKDGLPQTMFFGTAIYPHDAHKELQKFCDGKRAFDASFSDYVVPRGANSKLFQHVYGDGKDAPSFKDVKGPNDGPNVGTLESISKDAVLFHRCKDGSLIEQLRKQLFKPQDAAPEMNILVEQPVKRGPGRPRKNPEPTETLLTSQHQIE